MKYGIGYMGSKSKIAKDIIDLLPTGKRFVDLFGGGFAMSHCALLSGKYESVLYNDINPLIVQYVKDAITGKYSPLTFVPEFITRQLFYELKDKDGYVKYCWSFGNNGKDYLYSKEKEQLKHILHDFIVFGKWNDCLPKELLELVTAKDIKERRKQTKRFMKQNGKRLDIEHLERLQHLEHLERLQHLQHFEYLEITCADYKDYQYKDGDVVYCDIPYYKTKQYDNFFDFNAFFNWVKTRPYQVYFSNNEKIPQVFPCIWQKEIKTTLCSNNNAVKQNERLYVNKL